MTNDQVPMTNVGQIHLVIGAWSLVIDFASPLCHIARWGKSSPFLP